MAKRSSITYTLSTGEQVIIGGKTVEIHKPGSGYGMAETEAVSITLDRKTAEELLAIFEEEFVERCR